MILSSMWGRICHRTGYDSLFFVFKAENQQEEVLRVIPRNLNSYVLLDLYDLEAIQVYPVEDGAEYPIRIYTVAMADDEEQGNLVVTNIGHLFES